jgi:hypothetical protein
MMQQQQNALANANFQTAQRDRYAGVLDQLANEQLSQFQTNKMDPYNQARAMYMQNFQTGASNINQGVNGMAGAVSSSLPYIAAGDSWDTFNKIMGNPIVQ